MTNVTGRIGPNSVIRKSSFIAGWNSILTNSPFDYSIGSHGYEYGRISALRWKAAKGTLPAWNVQTALHALAMALNDEWVTSSFINKKVNAYAWLARETFSVAKQAKPRVDLSTVL